MEAGSCTWAHAPLPRLKRGSPGKRHPPPWAVSGLSSAFFFWDKGGSGRRCLGPKNRALVRRRTALVVSNLIGRLAEATNPVASIAGPELGHAPASVAQTRDLAATCTSFLPPFSLPPTWRGFIETSAPRAGSGARGGAGSRSAAVAGWGRELSAQGLWWTEGAPGWRWSTTADHGLVRAMCST